MSETNLLAYLAIQCRVDCFSDLSLTPECKEIIEKMKDGLFPLDEWNDAIDYLCKVNDISFSTERLAKEYLIKY